MADARRWRPASRLDFSPGPMGVLLTLPLTGIPPIDFGRARQAGEGDLSVSYDSDSSNTPAPQGRSTATLLFLPPGEGDAGIPTDYSWDGNEREGRNRAGWHMCSYRGCTAKGSQWVLVYPEATDPLGEGRLCGQHAVSWRSGDVTLDGILRDTEADWTDDMRNRCPGKGITTCMEVRRPGHVFCHDEEVYQERADAWKESCHLGDIQGTCYKPSVTPGGSCTACEMDKVSDQRCVTCGEGVADEMTDFRCVDGSDCYRKSRAYELDSDYYDLVVEARTHGTQPERDPVWKTAVPLYE